MSRRAKRDWPALIREYQRSGETQRSFCERRKLSVHTLQYHLRGFKSQESEVSSLVASGFIDLSEHRPTERVELELTLPSGAVLRLRG